MTIYRHILAAVDGSEPSQHALEQTLNLPGCRVTAAAVVPPPPDGLLMKKLWSPARNGAKPRALL